MLVTINTDASFHPSLKYGAYAFWAICDDFKITKSGVFRKKCQTPDDAEAKCIINALTVILKAHKGISKIIINTDSLNAIAYLTKDKNHILKYRLSMPKMRQFQQCLTLLPIRKIEIEYRHVKAHSGVNDKRSYVNEWCDSEAKKQLRKIVLSKKTAS
jgi:ribonuclease HI